MTPLDFARNLAASDDPEARALAVGIVTRGVTDDDPATHRQGWPLNAATVERAAAYLGLDATPELVADALAVAPTISGRMLNRA